MPAFLMIKCRRGTREADPHSRRVPPKVGGTLRAAGGDLAQPQTHLSQRESR
jgi:hypothetical protein